MNSNLRIDPIRSIRFRFSRLQGAIALLRSAILRDGHIEAIGAPIIEVFPGSSIRLGSHVCLVSVSFATALGVNHPVVLRTLRRDAQINIGARVGISGGSICAARYVEIGEDSMLGANVTIADTDFHAHGPDRPAGHEDPRIPVAEVMIGKRVFIGTNSIILKGVRVGDNAVVGAGSVVTKSIPANTIAAGNPCRVIREVTDDAISNAEVALVL